MRRTQGRVQSHATDCARALRAAHDLTSFFIVWATGHVTETELDLPYTTNPYNVNPLNKSAPGARRTSKAQATVCLHADTSLLGVYIHPEWGARDLRQASMLVP